MRALIIVAIAAVLIWQVTTRTLVSYLAKSAPETALSLRPLEPTALLNLADATLASAQSSDQEAQPKQQAAKPESIAPAGEKTGDPLRLWAELASKTVLDTPKPGRDRGAKAPSQPSPVSQETRDQVRAWIELALIEDPLNARALSSLGQLAHAAGDEATAEKFFQTAAQRSIRERVAIYWLMLKSYQKRDYAAAMKHADTLLRTRTQAADEVLPLLVQFAETRDASADLKAMVLANPPWRSSLLLALSQRATDPRTTLDLLLAMKGTSTPPHPRDLRYYVESLVARKQYELAYYAWLEYLPPEQLASAGFLFNGGFQLTPSGVPFDWMIGQGVGATADVVDDPERDGQRALLIEFGYGRVELPEVQQMTMLAPGTYQFKASHKGELVGKRGLVWRVACTDPPEPVIGETAMAIGSIPKWRETAFAFTVPAKNCRTQRVQLILDARMPSEQLVSGSVWYDDLRITRADRP